MKPSDRCHLQHHCITCKGCPALDATLRHTGTATPPSNRVKPAEVDRTNFQQLASVEWWRTFRPALGVDASKSAQSQLSAVLRRIQEGARATDAFDGFQSAAYWSYHLARMSFFALQGIVGVRPASPRSGCASALFFPTTSGQMLESCKLLN